MAHHDYINLLITVDSSKFSFTADLQEIELCSRKFTSILFFIHSCITVQSETRNQEVPKLSRIETKEPFSSLLRKTKSFCLAFRRLFLPVMLIINVNFPPKILFDKHILRFLLERLLYPVEIRNQACVHFLG